MYYAIAYGKKSLSPGKAPVSRAVFAEKEVLRLAMQQAMKVRPIDVERHFAIDHRSATLLLQKLSAKGWLKPIFRGTGQRVFEYELIRDVLDYFDY